LPLNSFVMSFRGIFILTSLKYEALFMYCIPFYIWYRIFDYLSIQIIAMDCAVFTSTVDSKAFLLLV
jgi:hypothetical protein